MDALLFAEAFPPTVRSLAVYAARDDIVNRLTKSVSYFPDGSIFRALVPHP